MLILHVSMFLLFMKQIILRIMIKIVFSYPAYFQN